MVHIPQVLPSEEIKRIFGNFQYTRNGDNTLDIKGDWVEENIVSVFIPELKGVPVELTGFSGNVRFHRLGVAQLVKAFHEIGKAGLAGDVKQWGGSFFPRMMRSGKSVSRHSWGTAFDINVPWNPYNSPAARPNEKGNVWRIVPILEANGFCSGARWKSPQDGMHFEIAELKDYKEVDDKPDALLVIDGQWKQAIALTIKDGQAYALHTAMAAQTHDTGVTGERLIPVATYLDMRGYKVTWNAEQKKIYATRISGATKPVQAAEPPEDTKTQASDNKSAGETTDPKKPG